MQSELERLVDDSRRMDDAVRAFFALSVDGALIMSPADGQILDCNERAAADLGYTRQELRTKTIGDIDDAFSPALVDARRSDIETRGWSTFETFHRSRDGRVRPVLVKVQPVQWQGARCMLTVCEDLSELKRTEGALRAAHDTFHHLVEQSPFGIYVVNADFRLVLVSAGAQRVFANVRPLLGRDFAEVLRTIWPEPFASEAIGHFRRTLVTGEPYHGPNTSEQRQDIPDVEAYDWKIERLMLPDGRFGVVCHFYDLSERQRVADELQEADRRKDEFIAMLAHELRNPLAPIRTAVGILQASEVCDPIVVRCRDIISRQVGMMSRLLDDLLDVSRLSHGRLTLHDQLVPLDAVLATASETSRPLVDQREQSFRAEVAPGLVVRGDATRLTQLFANLLNNAGKYTPAHGSIAVRAEREADRAVVRVRDTGVGIEPEMQDRVFDLFMRVNERDPRSDGLGVGLTLARQLAEMHGGSVTVQSEGPGLGSEFVVSLPLAPHDTLEGEAGDRHAVATCAPVRVLVVDDNVDAADTTTMLLEDLGCDVRAVYSGADAVRLAAAWHPTVVFMDLGMPGMDGFAAGQRLRSLPNGSDLMLVALSGWGQERDRERSALAGFNRHLTKPVEPEVLRQLVRDVAAR